MLRYFSSSDVFCFVGLLFFPSASWPLSFLSLFLSFSSSSDLAWFMRDCLRGVATANNRLHFRNQHNRNMSVKKKHAKINNQYQTDFWCFWIWPVFKIKITKFLLISNQNHSDEGDLNQNCDLNFENLDFDFKIKIMPNSAHFHLQTGTYSIDLTLSCADSFLNLMMRNIALRGDSWSIVVLTGPVFTVLRMLPVSPLL